MNERKFEILSLFSGGGFLDIGFINQGFEIAEAVEIEQSFIDAYNYAVDGYVDYLNSTNSNTWKVEHRDISKPVDASNSKQQKRLSNHHKGITGIIGGPPCQDFSNAGKNAGVEGERGKLINSYYRIVKNIKPEFLFFENVDGLLTNKKHSKAFLSLVRRISSLGYRVYFDVLNAMEYGIPQDRDRLTLVAFKREIIDTLKEGGFKDIRSKQKLKYSGDDSFIFKWPSIICKSPKEQTWPNEWVFGKKTTENPLKNLPEEYRCLAVINAWNGIADDSPNQKAQFKPYSDKFQTVKEGFVKNKSFKRLHRYRYSPAVAYGNNEVHLHPTELRRISVREALRLQSVPDAYVFPEKATLTDMFKIISNGVPVLKAELIAKEIRRTLVNYHKNQIVKVRTSTEKMVRLH